MISCSNKQRSWRSRHQIQQQRQQPMMQRKRDFRLDNVQQTAHYSAGLVCTTGVGVWKLMMYTSALQSSTADMDCSFQPLLACCRQVQSAYALLMCRNALICWSRRMICLLVSRVIWMLSWSDLGDSCSRRTRRYVMVLLTSDTLDSLVALFCLPSG